MGTFKYILVGFFIFILVFNISFISASEIEEQEEGGFFAKILNWFKTIFGSSDGQEIEEGQDLTPTNLNEPEDIQIEKKENLPYVNHSCYDLAPKSLIIGFETDSSFQLTDNPGGMVEGNVLIDGTKIEGVCRNHPKAQPGEYIWVEKLFTCSTHPIYINGGITEEGIVKRDYKISYVFEMDSRNCEKENWFSKSCIITSLECNWNYTN